MYKKGENDFYNLARSRIEIYSSLEDYIKDFVESNGRKITFDNYKSLFTLFFAVQSSILIWFLIVQVFKFYNINLIKFHEKQLELFTKYVIQLLKFQFQMILILIHKFISKISH